MTLGRRERLVVVVVTAAVLIGLVGYGLATYVVPAPDPARFTVVASIYPLQEFTSRMTGADVRVVTLVPPGIDPHDWEPTPGAIATVAAADLVVYLHPEFETFVPRILAAIDTPPPAVALALDIELIEYGEEESDRDGHAQEGEHDHDLDPHVWLDPLLAQQLVRNIRDALIQVDPAFAPDYRIQADLLVADLKTLHEEILAGLVGCELDVFITAHGSFGYFARQYGLVAVPIAINPEVEVSPARIAELVAFAREHGITVIFTEPLLSSAAAQQVAEEIGGTTRILDPIENLAPEDLAAGRNYFSIMRDNLLNLQVGLRCGG